MTEAIRPPIGSAAIEVAGESLWLLPERAVYWPNRRTLLVADLHLGKPAAFRAAALPVPERTSDADLERLTNAINAVHAERLVILGDLIHARSGQTTRTIEAVASWRRLRPEMNVVLVLGNHDRRCGCIPTEWRMEIEPEAMIEAPFVWRHWPGEHDAGYVVAGHLHPVATLRGKGRQKLRLRCFAVGRRRMVLPAFGGFTGGAVAAPDANDKVFVVADNQVLEVPGS